MSSLLIRADASIEQGSGHVMRCIALAQAWRDAGGDVILAANQIAPVADRLREENIEVVQMEVEAGSRDDAGVLVSLANTARAKWVAIDGYQFGDCYQKELVEGGQRLLALDDFGHAKYYHADFVLNQNIYADESIYRSRAARTRLLLGTRFALLRREFWQFQQTSPDESSRRNKLLVSLGGSDAANATRKVVETFQRLSSSDWCVDVVLGGGNPHLETVRQAVVELGERGTLHHNVSCMAELMSSADLAVSAGGSTCWELAFMRVPAIILMLADHQQKVAEGLAAAGAAVSLRCDSGVPVEALAATLTRLMQSQTERLRMKEMGRRLVDGRGAARVVAALHES